MGTEKQGNEWNEYATELWSLRDTKNPTTRSIFGKLSIHDLAAQITRLPALPGTGDTALDDTLAARLRNLRDIAAKESAVIVGRCDSEAAMTLAARAIDASKAAARSSRSTGSISASNCPTVTVSPTSTSTLLTRPAAVGPIR